MGCFLGCFLGGGLDVLETIFGGFADHRSSLGQEASWEGFGNGFVQQKQTSSRKFMPSN